MHFVFFFKDGEFHVKAKESFSFADWLKLFDNKESAVNELKEMLKSVKDAYQRLV